MLTGHNKAFLESITSLDPYDMFERFLMINRELWNENYDYLHEDLKMIIFNCAQEIVQDPTVLPTWIQNKYQGQEFIQNSIRERAYAFLISIGKAPK
ncbi:MAG: hypothetical protein M3Q64_00115 [bacterium]|nr:hypothetical protein [bacterium]